MSSFDMKKSIHKYKLDGYNIVTDICSGAVHVVDDTIYDILDFLEFPLPSACPEVLFSRFPNISRKVIAECYEQIHDLQIAGMIFTTDDYESYTGYSGDVPIKAMCLHVAHDCNLRCGYCFASTGDFKTGRALMSPQTAKKAVDYLIRNSRGRRFLEIDFFGGEPLMAWDAVRIAVEYARGMEALHDKIFRFTITTNGILLDDEKIEYINREMSNVVLSLDGRKEINDFMRPAVNGAGSYDIILPKFKKLIEGRIIEGRTDYYVRGTFTAHNLDFTKDIQSIAQLGFKNISVEPVTCAALGELPDYAIKESHLPAIKGEYERLYNIMKNDCDFNFFHYNLDLEQGPCAIKRLRGCGAGAEYVAVTPDEAVYPCHQFVGIEKWRLGDLDSPPNSDIKRYFTDTHVYSKEECRECWARFYCSGGCNAVNYLCEGDARKPHKISCELMKKRLECAIALYISIAEYGR